MTPEKALEILGVVVKPLTKMLTGSDVKIERLLTALEEFGRSDRSVAVARAVRIFYFPFQ